MKINSYENIFITSHECSNSGMLSTKKFKIHQCFITSLWLRVSYIFNIIRWWNVSSDDWLLFCFFKYMNCIVMRLTFERFSVLGEKSVYKIICSFHYSKHQIIILYLFVSINRNIIPILLDGIQLNYYLKKFVTQTFTSFLSRSLTFR